MLKWLLGALLLANLGVWMWSTWYAQSPVPAEIAPQPEIHADRMLAPGEPGARLVPRVPHRPVQTRSLTAVKRVCYAVGPFPRLNQATGGGARLKKLGLRYTLRSQPQTQRRFQVYLGPYRSKREAEAVQRRLRQLGIRDNALIHDGLLRNAVSVGVFTEAHNIKDARALLRRHNYRPHTRVVMQITNRYWLDVAAEQGSLDSVRALKWSTDGIAVEQSSCANATAQ